MNTRQLLKFLLVLGGIFALCYGLLFISGGAYRVVFDEMLSAFPYVATALSALSIALFTYVDNISKELTEIRNEVNRAAYVKVLEALSELKKEVLYNGGLIVLLLLIERAVNGVSIYWINHLPADQSSIAITTATSLRFSLFSISLWAATIQLKGFILALGLRDSFAKNRK